VSAEKVYASINEAVLYHRSTVANHISEVLNILNRYSSKVFWVVTPYSVPIGYCFIVLGCPHLQDEVCDARKWT
jgi:hypothetical protein